MYDFKIIFIAINNIPKLRQACYKIGGKYLRHTSRIAILLVRSQMNCGKGHIILFSGVLSSVSLASCLLPLRISVDTLSIAVFLETWDLCIGKMLEHSSLKQNTF